MPALGDHDRVHDEIGHVLRFEQLGDDLHDLGGREHAGLDRGHVEIVKDSIDLSHDDRQWKFKDVGHFFGILSGDRGDRRHCEHAIGRHRLDVRLNTGASAAVRPCNR